ncbi:hypothetical protein [uncultured Porphyromonas sp.]|uniref:hypothetical protein n=1 Tax=uncultured Porphyromonas sp. TaxID=159274 RepID=UPI00266CA3DB|nr:hypothetical protein [uncultured Porphyromonas sp.]
MTKSSTAPHRGGSIQTIYQEIQTILLGFSQVFLLRNVLSVWGVAKVQQWRKGCIANI